MKYKPTVIKNIEEAEINIKTLEPKNTRAFWSHFNHNLITQVDEYWFAKQRWTCEINL